MCSIVFTSLVLESQLALRYVKFREDEVRRTTGRIDSNGTAVLLDNGRLQNARLDYAISEEKRKRIARRSL